MYMEGKWRLAVDGVSLAYEAKVSLMLDVRSSRELKLTTPETRSQAVSSEPPLTPAGWTVAACTGNPLPEAQAQKGQCLGKAPMPTIVAGPIERATPPSSFR